MIRVYYNRGEGRHELTVNGHAGYAEYGKDIVCAGVSAIVFALLGWMEHNEEEIDDLEDMIAEDGQVYIACTGNDKLETAFQVAVLGLIQIARAHPDHVDIEYTGTAGDSRE